jgi:protein-tyrosine phosphatase
VQTTVELIRAAIPTLVACSAGMSRSPAIIAAALAITQRTPLEETLAAIASHGPIDVSPGLLADIKQIVDSPSHW